MFKELITDLVSRGGDADTNPCFAGALVGTYLGHKMLPRHWKHCPCHEKWLMGKTEALCRVLGVAGGEYNGQQDNDTGKDGGGGFFSQQEMEGRWMVLQQSSFKKMQDATNAAAATVAAKPTGSGWPLPSHVKGKRT